MSAVPRSIRRPAPLWDMLGNRLPPGLLGLSDPDVHLIDGRWVMLMGGFSNTFRNRLFIAVTDPGADPATARWILRRRPLAPDPGVGAWDAGGRHTPSHVPAHLGHPPLIFYAGRADRRHYGPRSAYAIGVMRQQPDGGWEPHPHPVVTGWADRPSVLEPCVIPVPGGFRMWFLATPHEVGPGEQPDYALYASDSADGVSWSTPIPFASRDEGFFDNAVYATPTGWEMIVARGTNLHGTVPFPEQGLWLLRSASPSPVRADWSEPMRILDTDVPGTPPWMARGVCGPSVALREDGSRIVFFTGTHGARSWLDGSRTRLRAARRLPVPSPYFLATGRAELPAP